MYSYFSDNPISIKAIHISDPPSRLQMSNFDMGLHSQKQTN